MIIIKIIVKTIDVNKSFVAIKNAQNIINFGVMSDKEKLVIYYNSQALINEKYLLNQQKNYYYYIFIYLN